MQYHVLRASTWTATFAYVLQRTIRVWPIGQLAPSNIQLLIPASLAKIIKKSLTSRQISLLNFNQSLLPFLLHSPRTLTLMEANLCMHVENFILLLYYAQIYIALKSIQIACWVMKSQTCLSWLFQCILKLFCF